MRDPFPGIPTLTVAAIKAAGQPEWPAVPEGTTWQYVTSSSSITWYGTFGLVSLKKHCRVYWGSHGCDLHRGHKGPCDCGCCTCESHPDPDSGCVGKYPFYGPETRFYGEDVAVRGLPHVAEAP